MRGTTHSRASVDLARTLTVSQTLVTALAMVLAVVTGALVVGYTALAVTGLAVLVAGVGLARLARRVRLRRRGGARARSVGVPYTNVRLRF